MKIYSFVLKYRPIKYDRVVDELSIRVLLLSIMIIEVVGLHSKKVLYEEDVDFEEVCKYL
jgi:hypothetical protein